VSRRKLTLLGWLPNLRDQGPAREYPHDLHRPLQRVLRIDAFLPQGGYESSHGMPTLENGDLLTARRHLVEYCQAPRLEIRSIDRSHMTSLND
jgi:hypothetical protein